MASELLRELKDLQAMLGSVSPRIGAAIPPRPAATASEDDDEALPAPPLPRAPGSPAKHARELERQAEALRQQAAEGDARCRRLEEALQAAGHDGSLAVQRLQSQLGAKTKEVRRRMVKHQAV